MSDQPAVSIAQTLEALTREVRQMKAENARLHCRLSDLEGRSGAVSNGASPSAAVEPVTEVPCEHGTDRLVSRRGALRALGGAAAGGVGLAIGSTLLGAGPAAANEPGGTEGGALIIGASGSDANSASSSTQVLTSGGVGLAGGTTEHGQSGVEGQDLTSASPYGVGVTGTSTGGTGVAGNTGAAGAYGVIGVGVGFSGQGFAPGGGVWGDSSTGVGVLGTSSGDNGVFGVTDAAQAIGVAGTDVGGHDLSTGGFGVTGFSEHGIGGRFGGGLSSLLLSPSDAFGPPTAAFAHSEGEIYIDENVAIFICTVAGSPGTWREVTAAAPRFNNNNSGITGSLGLAGSVNLLSAPIRVFDSRSADTPAASSRPAGQLAAGTTTTLQITGAAVGGVSVPAGAVAVIGNVTSANPQGLGFLTLFPANATQPATSTLNFESVNIANSCVMTLSPSGQLKVNVGQHATDVIFDVTGFVF
jgi:hypothetical protein